MDYGQDLLFGTFVTPTAQSPQQAVELAKVADRNGLDLVTFQDHPYQTSFLDAWTLISYAAAQTERVHLSANVLNMRLRQPAIVARSAASLDRLSNGRVELGIGAGGFAEAANSMGARPMTNGESVRALEESIAIIRDLWNTEKRGGVTLDGEFHSVRGAKRGPAPVHPIGIWIGALGPKMLDLVGRIGDGWLPSLPYLKGGTAALDEMNRQIDEGAERAGRKPSDVRRLLNIVGQFSSSNGGYLVGPPAQWAEELAETTLTHGVTGFILMADDAYTTESYANEVAPAVREIVAAARGAAI